MRFSTFNLTQSGLPINKIDEYGFLSPNFPYILDEPTTGLHFDDIKKLLIVLNRLVDNGETVIVIEHNLEVIKNADYIIDLGPAGGTNGGEIIACGTPEEIISSPKSLTGKYLKDIL